MILDLFLGEENGLDFLTEVSAKYTELKTIVYSMYTNPGIVTLALECGAKAFVSKAESEAELLQAVLAVKDGKSWVTGGLVQPLVTYRSILESLTKQERKIFNKIIARKTNEQIAGELSLARRSVENYLSRIYSKTGCKNHEEILARFG